MLHTETLFILLAAAVGVVVNLCRVLNPRLLSLVKRQNSLLIWTSVERQISKPNECYIRQIEGFFHRHETAQLLTSLIQNDGAGTWPPLTNHVLSSWPEALRPYKAIYEELNPLLAVQRPPLDDLESRELISRYRRKFIRLLSERVDLQKVLELLEAAEAGRWDLLPRPTYNAFYACIGYCRHAYRWGIIPVVRVAQKERTLQLPSELALPWAKMQKHFGVESDSANLTSALIHNIDQSGQPALRINRNVSEPILRTEEIFIRLFYDVEVLALPIYCELAKAVIQFERRNGPACADSIEDVEKRLKHIFKTFYSTLHDKLIAISAWMPHVQGFFAWAVDRVGNSGELITSNGVSGNQLLVFMVLDGFLGLETYLDDVTISASVPMRQRAVAEAFEKASFRHKLDELGDRESEYRIHKSLAAILRQLRLFRSAHRHRARTYLMRPAPERLPMTAGKSVLKADIESSLADMDQFMLRRLAQTV